MKQGAGPSFVTSISPDGRAPGYLVIEVDGARYASLPAEVVTSVGLGAGLRLQAETWDALNAAADAEAAYQVGLRSLRARPRSHFEMRKRLADRGYRGAAASSAIARLQEQGFLDDRTYAMHFAEVRLSRGHGRMRILSDLSNRGVSRDIAESVLKEVLAGVEFDESSEIERAVENRLSQLAHLDPSVQKRRLLGYLQRRGYGGGEVFDIVDRKIREQTAG